MKKKYAHVIRVLALNSIFVHIYISPNELEAQWRAYALRNDVRVAVAETSGELNLPFDQLGMCFFLSISIALTLCLHINSKRGCHWHFTLNKYSCPATMNCV